MKKSFKNLVIVLTTFTLMACQGGESSTQPEYDFTFTGFITLGNPETDSDILYNLVMTGKDGVFKLSPNALTPIRGVYTFTAGQGYTFSFNDANGTDVRTRWDSAKKEHHFIYTLDLGEARGSGNVKLTYQDNSFTQVGDPWSAIPSFVGICNAGFIQAEIKVVCKANGTWNSFSTNFGTYVTQMTGSYTFENDSYTFVTSDNSKTFSSTINEDGLHVISVPVDIPALAAYVPSIPDAVCTEIVLTVD